MSNPFKVAYLISALDKSGPVNILYGIIRHLECDPEKLVIITLKDIPEEKSREQDFLDLGVRVIHAKLSTFDLLSGYRKLKKILLDNQVTIIHSHCLRSCTYNALFSGKYTSIHTAHSDPFREYRFLLPFPFSWFFILVLLLSLRFMTCIVGCASYIEKRLSSYIRPIHLTHITNGIDVSFFTPATESERSDLISQLDWAPGKIHLIASSRITRQKNFSFLLKALQDFGDRIHLIVLGNGDQFDLFKQSNQKGIIEFRGFCEDVRPYLQSADYFISASRLEGFSCSVLEAMACGTPVILSGIPSHSILKETEESRSSSVFFSLDDTAGLSSIFEKIANGTLSLSRESARDLVCTHYTAQKMSQAYLDLYCKYS